MNSPEERDARESAPLRDGEAIHGGLPPGTVSRAAWFLGLWLVLAGADPVDLSAGAIAVAAAPRTAHPGSGSARACAVLAVARAGPLRSVSLRSGRHFVESAHAGGAV